ncbi:hypothetical protein N9Y17_00575 [Gammaproteobacteria bacterium]|nr:hypothetical protein [Gammaproteobacteria bacterium]
MITKQDIEKAKTKDVLNDYLETLSSGDQNRHYKDHDNNDGLINLAKLKSIHIDLQNHSELEVLMDKMTWPIGIALLLIAASVATFSLHVIVIGALCIGISAMIIGLSGYFNHGEIKESLAQFPVAENEVNPTSASGLHHKQKLDDTIDNQARDLDQINQIDENPDDKQTLTYL